MKSYEIGTIFYARFTSSDGQKNSHHSRMKVVTEDNQSVGVSFVSWINELLTELPKECIIDNFKIVTP